MVRVFVFLWLQGCCHMCNGCHNPDTWDVNGGLELPNTYIDDIIDLLSKNGIHRNLSILGGEPCLPSNVSIVLPLLKKFVQRYIALKYTYGVVTHMSNFWVEMILKSCYNI